MIIEAGDIVGCRGIGWLSDKIVAATGNGPWSHVGIITATQPFIQVTEALSRVVVRSLGDRLEDAAHVWIMKPPLDPSQRELAARRALKYVGHDYAYGNIVAQLLDGLAQDEWFTEHWVNVKAGEVICSELVAICNDFLGLRPDDATPNDWWGFGAQVQGWPVMQLK